jgi:hypothetical protein
MRNALLFVVLACVLTMTGCLTLSICPLYTAKDVVTDPAIEGKWADPDTKDVWAIQKFGDSAYIATNPADENGEPVELRLVQLGERRFVDLTAKDTPSLAVAGHVFGKLWVTGDVLHLQMMSDKWLEKKARDAGLAFATGPDKDVLVTASTADLQKFVLKYADDPDAYDSPSVLHRTK